MVAMTIVIEDAESLRVEFTFWDNWALMWNDYEAQNGYNASEFKIEMRNQDNHVLLQSLCKVLSRECIQYESGWAYTGCKACKTKVTAIASKGASGSRNKKQPWHCKKHGETYAVVSRFKIIVCILDESGSAQVVIFDNNVYKMTKLSVWEIMEKQEWMLIDTFLKSSTKLL
ncbi:replication protein A 70 kDa DNA-binding subunit B [Tanacetum coccineum]